jgi:hypothetical protein
MADYSADENPEISFPVWLLGYPTSSPGNPVDLADGLLVLTSKDGEECIPIFTEESVAERFLETHEGELTESRVPKVVTEAEHLDLLLKFYAEKHGA